MPTPHIILTDKFSCKLFFMYLQMYYLNNRDRDKKQEVFSWVYNCVHEIASKRYHDMDLSDIGQIMILQVDDQGYQDTQMSKETLAIEHKKGEIVMVHRQPFSTEKPMKSSTKKSSNTTPATSAMIENDDDDEVVITNDDNADVSLPCCPIPEKLARFVTDHPYPSKNLSLSKKKLPNISAPKTWPTVSGNEVK